MKRTLTMLMMFAVLAMPMLATADDQTIPPEANWTPTPPARQTVDAASLVSLLAQKGMITPQEYAQLTSPQSSAISEARQARVWTWDQVDRNPVLTTP
jgi:hypothetical protein